jgi:hypothetical protein
MLSKYFAKCDYCIELFAKAFEIYSKQGLGEEFTVAVNNTHEVESAADDLRRDIELTLYGKALLPESRGDLLGLLEAFDRLPNRVEAVLFTILCQETIIPAQLIMDYQDLVDLNLKAYDLVRKAVDALFHNPKITLHVTKEVDERESESDRIERSLICRIFKSDFDTGTKLLLKEIVLMIGSISDLAEKTADRIGIIAIKRQV